MAHEVTNSREARETVTSLTLELTDYALSRLSPIRSNLNGPSDFAATVAIRLQQVFVCEC